MAKTKYTLLIPLNYNDGAKVPDDMLNKIYDDFYVLANGYANVGTAIGAYRMKDGSKQVDHSAIVWVGIDEGDEEKLKQLAGDIARRLGQEAIYLERTGGTIEFIPPLRVGDEL